ncbi:Transposable element Tcb2 transposase [Anabarilius grahami]|uniref:Transposable element Tcb2 transposase n=1 Tax=Anabarilius grahami TaxID=495550 RepID=A0A3N0Z238_ANAGA|nr:Transposable element Tcb2 transposase [Anabarilius grahami]
MFSAVAGPSPAPVADESGGGVCGSDINSVSEEETQEERDRDEGVRVEPATLLEWPNQSPDLNPIEHLWRDLKMAVHQRLPSNLTELERICKEEWQRIPKSRCEKLVASFPKRLMAVLDQKGASTKY